MWRRRRKLWIILLATPLALLGADSLYWRITASHLEDGFTAWAAQQRAAGWIVNYQHPSRGGWPLAATLTVPAVSLQGAKSETSGRLAWSAQRLELRIALSQPGLLQIASDGPQRLRLGESLDVPYSANHLRLVLPLQPEPWPRFTDISAENLHADIGGDLAVRSLRLHLDFRPEAQSGEPALLFSLQSEAINPPSAMIRPFTERIATLAVDGAINGPVPAADTLANQATSWRDGGGSIEIQHLALTWGPLDLTASATLALDEQLQPMGAGNAKIVGYNETLDALASRAVISRSAATAAKAVLSLLAHAPDDGSAPDVEVPLTLQYRTLSMRQVPLVRLPELDWP